MRYHVIFTNMGGAHLVGGVIMVFQVRGCMASKAICGKLIIFNNASQTTGTSVTNAQIIKRKAKK